MNNSINILSKRILPASLSALAVLLLASCADESTPASADKLPAEVCFTAALGAPLTRATTSGVWETGELVAVEIGSERKQYVVRTADGTMSGNGEANTYYWMTPSDPPKEVTAWHLGQWNGAEAAQVDMACPGTFSVATDQTAGTAASDFVYAPLQTISFGGNSTLKFYHQLALLTIRLDLEQGHISKLLIGTYADPVAVGGDFTAPSGGNQVFGAWDTTSGATGVVSACRLASSGKEGYPLCYQCVMLPQDRQGKPFITVVLTSGERYTWTDTENCTKWAPGVSYSYNFRLRNGLIENVTDEEWLPEGAQGSISVVATMWDGTSLPYGVTASDDHWDEYTETFGFIVRDDWWLKTDLSRGIVDSTVEWLRNEQSFGISVFDTPWDDQAANGGITTDPEQWEQGSDQSGLDVTNHPWGEDTKEDDVIVNDDEWQQGTDPGGVKPTVNPWGEGEEHDTPDGVTTTPWREDPNHD